MYDPTQRFEWHQILMTLRAQPEDQQRYCEIGSFSGPSVQTREGDALTQNISTTVRIGIWGTDCFGGATQGCRGIQEFQISDEGARSC